MPLLAIAPDRGCQKRCLPRAGYLARSRAEQRGIRVCRHALSEGVWLRPLGNVVVIMPPLAISLEELDRICSAVERGVAMATSMA